MNAYIIAGFRSAVGKAERALSDGAQSLSLEAFEALMKDAGLIADACGRSFESPRGLPFTTRASGSNA